MAALGAELRLGRNLPATCGTRDERHCSLRFPTVPGILVLSRAVGLSLDAATFRQPLKCRSLLDSSSSNSATRAVFLEDRYGLRQSSSVRPVIHEKSAVLPVT